MSHKLHRGLCQVYQTLCDTFCKKNTVKSVSLKIATPEASNAQGQESLGLSENTLVSLTRSL